MTPEDIDYNRRIYSDFRKNVENLFLTFIHVGNSWDELNYFYDTCPELRRYIDNSFGIDSYPFEGNLDETSLIVGDWLSAIDKWYIEKYPIIIQKLEQQVEDTDEEDEGEI